jgi:hypothetical protein
MSYAIPAVSPIAIASVVQPIGGSTVTAGTIALTSPSAASNPVVVQPAAGGTVNMAMATPGAQAVIQAVAGSQVSVGVGLDALGNRQSLAGSVIQTSDASAGSVLVDLAGAVVGGTKVAGSTQLGGDRGGVGTIAANAPAGIFDNAATAPDTYIQTGAGNDQIEGTVGIDFIRAGAGDDTINAGGGNDIVRPGSGNDNLTLGQGNDVVYLTIDQLQGTQTKTISDFKASGADKIQISKDLQGLVSITGQGTKQIVISLSGAQSGTTTIRSGDVNGKVINNDDIQFV